MDDKFCFAIDRGGTFTDVYARCPGGKVQVMKLLSEDPANYADAPTEGIRRIIEQVNIYFVLSCLHLARDDAWIYCGARESQGRDTSSVF